MSIKLRWGVLGTGYVCGQFAKTITASDTGELVACGSRTQTKADAFGEAHGVAQCHGSYDSLLADDSYDALYIGTLHPSHARWAIRSAEAGKHVLCEKPLALNYAQASRVIEAARDQGVFLMEAFMYRCHPQMQKLVELIRSGAIGRVRMIRAAFSFDCGWEPSQRWLNGDLGGGAILDVGCYCSSAVRLIAGAALGQDAAEPEQIHAIGHVGQTQVDEYTTAVMRFPRGITAELTTGVRLPVQKQLMVYGSEGELELPDPWMPSGESGYTTLILRDMRGRQQEQIRVDVNQRLYGYELDAVTDAIARGQTQCDYMTWTDTLGNMRVLDAWRKAVGVSYKDESPKEHDVPLHGRPLARTSGHPMKYGGIDGIDMPISRLVMGCDNQRTFADAAVLFDDYFEQGGNTFDTAHIYGGGLQERLLGQWLRSRGVLDQVVLISKGAHTPDNLPDRILPQLEESFDRLDVDHVDMYFLHRDNPDVPTGEFIDALNELRDDGRFRVFGASNWHIERVEAANQYAREHGKQGFSAVSNNFSLARMVNPVWDGCLTASSRESTRWFQATQMPLFAWSSQARGFFVPGLADPNDRSDRMLSMPWYSDDNFRRLERVNAMAKRYGIHPINIALAYVLCQTFPTFALIGPRVLRELRSSLPAMDIELTPADLRWLNLDADSRPELAPVVKARVRQGTVTATRS